MLQKLLKHKFSNINLSNYLELTKKADALTLLNWAERLMDAECIEEVFQ